MPTIKTFWQDYISGRGFGVNQGLPFRGNKALTNVSVTNAATLVLAANLNRTKALIINKGGSDIFLGPANTVAAGAGYWLASGQSLTDDFSCDAWWAITSAGTGDVRVLEIS